MPTTQATWMQFLLSPSGRFNRARFWGSTFLVYGVMIAYLVPVIVLDQPRAASDSASLLFVVYVVVGLALLLGGSLAHVFTVVKRFHDRDKPWPWYCIGYVPFIGPFWVLIECGFLPGTVGRNRYGADPLNSLEIADVFDGPVPAVAASPEPRLPPKFGVTSQDRPI